MSFDSYASIEGIAVLENPRRLSNTSKTFIFDAQFFLGSTQKPSLLGLLHYFNGDNLTFSPLPTKCMVKATIAKMDLALNTYSTAESSLEPDDYDFVGDVYDLILLGHASSPEETDDSEEPTLEYVDDPTCPGSPKANFGASINDNNSEPNKITFPIDPCRRPTVHISGRVVNAKRKTATFKLDVVQYISAFKSDTTKTAKPNLPITCIIPDSPRFKSGNKPVPFDHRYVSLDGHLADVVIGAPKDGKAGKIERFLIEVIATLGYYTPTAVAPAAKTAKENVTPSPTNRATRKLGYSFSPSPSPAPPAKRPRLSINSNGSTPAGN
ncbi:hypothetical protein BD779DRAFT_1475969 [Infundibulicybe gibba]|nr:hypothetical protein BD779DRAFT_1475969 [Infundibulicybe gibba]